MSPFPTKAALRLLTETDTAHVDNLCGHADRVRAAHVGDKVHLRGLLEISNCCVRECHYCGIRAGAQVRRYRMSRAEIVEGARKAERLGYGTVVLQAGEDPGLTRDLIAEIVLEIKGETRLAVTLSLGEQEDDTLLAWRAAGADRYLLRFETSDPELYARLHPSPRSRRSPDRVMQLLRLREMGFEIGTGMMVGLPGQSWETLAQDLALCRELDADMIGVGPFIPAPGTPLAAMAGALAADQQVPNDEVTTLKVMALARLLCPEANIPSTTALASIDPARGRERGLQSGANVVMPNVTPPQYRVLYEIYPSKACIHETADVCRACMERRILSIGRRLGSGPGGRRRAATMPLPIEQTP